MKHRIIGASLIGLALGAVMLFGLGAAGPTSYPPSPFTIKLGTNVNAAGWRSALGTTASTNAALTGGTVTGQTNLDLTASRVMVSDANKVPASSSVTATTLGYLDATSSVQTQLDSKPTVALTNVALLSTDQTITGTKTFNASPLFQGFAIARSIYLIATNHLVTVTAGINATQPTNAGDYALCGAVGTFTIPALPATWTNVGFNFKVTAQKTAVGNATSQLHLYGGPATNWLGLGQNLGSGANNYFSLNNAGLFTWMNLTAHTNQIANAAASTIISGNTPANLIDTSAPWTLYIGYSTSGTTTTIDIKHIVVEAINLN